MMGYSMHGGLSIRHRSGAFDVPVGTAPYAQFVSFKRIEDAKAFIDSGRNPDGHVIYDMKTQAPIK